MEPIAEDVLPGLVFCTYMNAGRYILCESLPAYHEYIAQGNLKAAERLTFDPNSNEKPPLLRKKLRLLRKAYK